MALLNFPNGFCLIDFWNILTLSYFKGTIFWFYSHFLPNVMVKILFVFCSSFKFNVCASIDLHKDVDLKCLSIDQIHWSKHIFLNL